MPQYLLGRRFGHNLLIRAGLRAYALTLLLLGFKFGFKFGGQLFITDPDAHGDLLANFI